MHVDDFFRSLQSVFFFCFSLQRGEERFREEGEMAQKNREEGERTQKKRETGEIA